MKHKIYYIQDQGTNQRLGNTTFNINDAYNEKAELTKKLSSTSLEIKEVIKSPIVKVDLLDNEIDTLENKIIDGLTDGAPIVEKIVKKIVKKVKKSKSKKKTGKKSK